MWANESFVQPVKKVTVEMCETSSDKPRYRVGFTDLFWDVVLEAKFIVDSDTKIHFLKYVVELVSEHKNDFISLLDSNERRATFEYMSLNVNLRYFNSPLKFWKRESEVVVARTTQVKVQNF